MLLNKYKNEHLYNNDDRLDRWCDDQGDGDVGDIVVVVIAFFAIMAFIAFEVLIFVANKQL